MTTIHASSVVDPKAEIGSDVEIGPFCVVGPNVKLGEGTQLLSHVVIEGKTSIGAGCRIFPFASIGHIPQDLKYEGEKSSLEIGDNNVIREYVTINPGTEGGGMVTRVGSNCLLMAQAHVAHDCQLGNNVIMANGATLAGHCEIGDFAILGGLCACHQFVRVGEHAFIGGMSGVENDVIPFGMVVGERANLKGLNIVGIKRSGLSRAQLKTLRAAYDLLFKGEGTLLGRAEQVAEQYGGEELVDRLVEFITADTSRSFSVPKQTSS